MYRFVEIGICHQTLPVVVALESNHCLDILRLNFVPERHLTAIMKC